MLARAVAEVEAKLPELMAPELQAWAQAAERNAKRQLGVADAQAQHH